MPHYHITKLLETYSCHAISATGMMADSPGGDRVIIQCFMNLVKSLDSVLLLLLLLFLIWTLSFPPAYALPILSVLILNGASKI